MQCNLNVNVNFQTYSDLMWIKQQYTTHDWGMIYGIVYGIVLPTLLPITNHYCPSNIMNKNWPRSEP